MSVEVTGMQEMMRNIESRLGRPAMERMAGQAIRPGAEIVYRNMQRSMESFKDTGASKDEMKISEIQTSRGKVRIRIYWQGPRNRYRLIHLNEHGYTRYGKRYSPPGLGKIAGAMRSSERSYFDRVRKGLSQ